MIGIVDYNMGNLASVINAFAKVGVDTRVESDPSRLREYDKLILPGVGAFGDAMEHLKQRGMDSAVKEFASSGKPLLGICLGMQLLFDSSEEFGTSEGLGLIEGKVIAFDESKFDHALKVPHMGWNEMFSRGLTSNDLLQSNESFAGLTPTISNDLLQSNESFAGLTPTISNDLLQSNESFAGLTPINVGADLCVCPLFTGLENNFYLYFVHSFHAVCDDKYAIGKTFYGYEFVSAVNKDNIYGIQPHPEKSHENGLKIIENFANL